MKSITKLALVAVLGALGTGVVLADNDQSYKLRELERQAAERERASATVGVYVDGQGVRADGQRVRHETTVEYAPRTQGGVELRRDSHGGFYFAPAETYR